MLTIKQLGKCAAAAALTTLALPASASGQTTVFGSDNDSLDGFIQGADGPDIAWTSPIPADNVEIVNNGVTNDGNQNHTLLKEFTYDSSIGSSYIMTGSVSWTSYADDNNRIAMYLLGDTATPGDNETGALAIIYNADDAQLKVGTGVNGAFQTFDLTGDFPFTPSAGPPDSNFNDYALDFETTFTFAAGGDVVLDFGMTYSDSASNLITDTFNFTVDSSLVTFDGNDYFGFAGRGRKRDAADNEYIAQYQDFSLTAVPEPASFPLIAGGLACLVLLRRH
jgi:hypothetical protein